jgi:hypothetical protein
MKGSVPRPPWPAPEAKTATRTDATSSRSARPDDGSEPSIDRSNRITLAVLEETSAAHRARGYDPYNTSVTVPRPTDVWKRKPKRG